MEPEKDIGLSPEQKDHIKAAIKRHVKIDPGCENLTPEEFINWHPVGGISWEERFRLMKAAGMTEPAENSGLSELQRESREQVPVLTSSGK